MNTLEKRDFIHSYLHRLDDEHIDEMFKTIQAIIEEDSLLTTAQEQELEYRVQRHKTKESKSIPWDEVKKNAQSKL